MKSMTRHEYLVWLCLLAGLLAATVFKDDLAGLVRYPDAAVPDLTTRLNRMMEAVVDASGVYFNAISVALEVPLGWLQLGLNALPWPVTIFLSAAIAYAASGWRLSVFTTLAMLYMAVIGYWQESMNSLSLVLFSVPLAVAIGFAFGVAAYASRPANTVIQPVLDLLQTIPTFAYLLPILLLFGFGPVVGLVASVLYAFAPMVRNTAVGLRRVDPEIIEAGLMAGASDWQLFWRVRVPSAERQILLGINQTTMAALSMVIIASLIGGTADIGWEVLNTMRKAQFGESLLAGLVIALIAMVLDRITVGFAKRDHAEEAEADDHRKQTLLLVVAGCVMLIVLAQIWPAAQDFPRNWEVHPAPYLNAMIDYIVVNFQFLINKLKTIGFFYAMLPVKIGFNNTVTPFSWGFELTMLHRLAYSLLILGIMGASVWAGYRRLSLLVGFTGFLLWFGLTDLPELPAFALAVFLGWRCGGTTLAIGVFLGLGFIIVAGIWPEAMLTVYLCGIAAMVAFSVGAGLGIWAAHDDRVSAILRPINDTLQTMPLFVLLIPFVMIFKIGEFTALLAIIAYAMVPAIRYAETGLRGVPGDVVEAAEQMGCDFFQMLWRVKLPQAAPSLLLGLNQTVMYAIAMLVIAALVGTNGLGQQVYIGLGDGDFGVSMIAGLGMAIIAMIADRAFQNVARQFGAAQHH